ncbi:MAG: serine/threonine-protein phosphatase [Chloroflexaceae bacterium]|nr:serine/threonine-protein phosphatase [Chloroflexaceae bacterium]
MDQEAAGTPQASAPEVPLTTNQPLRVGTRYELLPPLEAGAEPNGIVTVRDLEPWRRCWQCLSTDNLAGEAYCTNCGAALEVRTYRAWYGGQADLSGEALLATLEADSPILACEALPELWDVVEPEDAEGPVLVVFYHDTGLPVPLPLDEPTALSVGVQLARLLHELHQAELYLGAVSPDDVVQGVDDHIRLRRAAGLYAGDASDSTAAALNQQRDLHELGVLLEALTSTPRTTRRLDDTAASALIEQEQQGTLAMILRQIRTHELTSAADVLAALEQLLHALRVPIPLLQQIAAASHRGVVRDHNEDSCLHLSLVVNNSSVNLPVGVFIVADGMGGHAAGEVASRLAVQHAAIVIMQDYFAPLLDGENTYDPQAAADLLTRAVLRANEAVRREGYRRGNDMGTTITMALVVGDRATIANVGDSRTYLMRDGVLRRVTRDHSLVMRLVEIGQITEQDIYTHPQRNAVLRSLGDQLDIEVDIFREQLHPNDLLLLCSDGLWEMTHNPEMTDILNRIGDVDTATHALIDAANIAGGEDNVTAVLVRFVPSPEPDA